MRRTVLAIAFVLALALAGCASTEGAASSSAPESQSASQESEIPMSEEQPASQQPGTAEAEQETNEEEAVEMRLSIDGTDVNVEWEDNQAVADLMALAADGPITVDLSMYGGFEQVGPLGASLTANDEQMTTVPGDIVLYAGNQVSIFYDSNSWSYTKLGHVSDKTADEMTDLLGNGDVSITITVQ